MAVAPLVAKFENGSLVVMRGDTPVIFQPFKPAIGNEDRRDWIDEEDAIAYWETVKDDYVYCGCSPQEISEIVNGI